MKSEVFWKIIDEARSDSRGEVDLIKVKLKTSLQALECSEVADFVFWNWRYRSGVISSPPMIAAICLLLNEELTDNSFVEMQHTIIAQGKDFFLNAIGDPDSMIDHRKKLIVPLQPHEIAKDIYFERCGGGKPDNSLIEKLDQVGGMLSFDPYKMAYSGVTDFEIASKFGKLWCPRLWEKYNKLLDLSN